MTARERLLVMAFIVVVLVVAGLMLDVEAPDDRHCTVRGWGSDCENQP